MRRSGDSWRRLHRVAAPPRSGGVVTARGVRERGVGEDPAEEAEALADTGRVVGGVGARRREKVKEARVEVEVKIKKRCKRKSKKKIMIVLRRYSLKMMILPKS